MARDPALLDRLYGAKPAPEQDPRKVAITSPVLPLLWLIGLVGLGLASVAVALGTLALGLVAGSGPLGEWGVLRAEDVALVVHDHSPTRDGSAGCVVTQDRLVRWENERPFAEVALAGAIVEVDDVGVHVTGGAITVDCPFGAGEDPWTLASTARRIAAR